MTCDNSTRTAALPGSAPARVFNHWFPGKLLHCCGCLRRASQGARRRLSSAAARRKLSCAAANLPLAARPPRSRSIPPRGRFAPPRPRRRVARRPPRARAGPSLAPGGRALRGRPELERHAVIGLKGCAAAKRNSSRVPPAKRESSTNGEALGGSRGRRAAPERSPYVLERMRRQRRGCRVRQSQSGANRSRRPATSCRQGRQTRRCARSVEISHRRSRRCATACRKYLAIAAARARPQKLSCEQRGDAGHPRVGRLRHMTSYWRADRRRCDRPSPTSRRTAGLRNTP